MVGVVRSGCCTLTVTARNRFLDPTFREEEVVQTPEQQTTVSNDALSESVPVRE